MPLMRPHGEPLAELVLTVLSQSTNDRNRDVAFLGLRERLPTWEHVRDAPVVEVEGRRSDRGASPRSSQLASRRSCVRSATPAHRSRSMPTAGSFRSTGSRRRADRAPTRLRLAPPPGVGRKTAACVLLFAYGLRDVPVDTHVSACRHAPPAAATYRGASFEELHDEMLAPTPPGEEPRLHVNLLRHGRRTRHARSPACAECALARMRPSRQLLV